MRSDLNVIAKCQCGKRVDMLEGTWWFVDFGISSKYLPQGSFIACGCEDQDTNELDMGNNMSLIFVFA